MWSKIRSKKAQAVLEMGLLGSFILIVFSLLVGYIQRLNDDQYASMNNFRAALKKAHDNNAIVSYTTIEARRHVDTNTPLLGQRTNVSASNYVHWAVPYAGSSPNRGFYYKFNEEEVALNQDDEVEDIVFGYDTDTDREFTKIEAGDIISTVQDVDVAEELTYILRNPTGGAIRTIVQNREVDKKRMWETEDVLGLEE